MEAQRLGMAKSKKWSCHINPIFNPYKVKLEPID